MKALTETLPLFITSPSFYHGDLIPIKYTCEGENVSPPITIENIPPGTTSLALIVEDPDAHRGTFDHWVVWNIPPLDKIVENSVPGDIGKNSLGNLSYTGPCLAEGVHRYFFKVFALDKFLDLEEGSSKKSLEKVMQNHILATAEFVGLAKASGRKAPRVQRLTNITF
jgi:Raf kinase inhibitor-like YbhB/YbcL family protein